MADVSVRPATPADAAAVARVQAGVWSRLYVGLLPPGELAALDSPESVLSWRTAVASPPTPKHRVLVALEGAHVVGFSALGPAADPDLVPGLDAEIQVLCVAPDRTGSGHGSRLVNASADVARDDGFDHVHVWLTEREDELRAFLEKAGWVDDGSRRSLDLHGDGEVLVDQVRLRARVGEDG
jgi:GNAT superfamily N-acetyltransferase